MNSIENVICPDCEDEYISVKRLQKYGRCVRCERRYKMSIKHNKEYVPICSLSKKERKDILSRRKIMIEKSNKKSSNKKSSNKKSNKSESLYTKELIEYCLNLKNQGIMYKDIITKIQEEINPKFTKSGLMSAIWRYKQNNTEVKQEDTLKTHRVNPIIKTTIINHDKINETEQPSTLDTPIDLVEDKSKLIDDNSDVISNKEPELNIATDISFSGEEQKLDNDTLIDSDLKDEVDKVAEQKFKLLKCNELEHFNTDDYIKMLEMLEYLTVNRQQILKHRQTQHDVMNAYQDDVLHEIEKVDPEDGDNTLQKKLHIVRNKRRYYEYDYNDIGIMKQFLECVDIKKLKIVLGQLKKFKEVRDNPVFIPSVDKQMISKYDWTIKTKKEPSIKTTKITPTISVIHTLETLDDKSLPDKFKQSFTEPYEFFNISNEKKLNKYRASCKLSGGGFGAFRTYFKDYSCINEEIAESYFKQDLDILKSKHKGLLITEIQVNRINL